MFIFPNLYFFCQHWPLLFNYVHCQTSEFKTILNVCCCFLNICSFDRYYFSVRGELRKFRFDNLLLIILWQITLLPNETKQNWTKHEESLWCCWCCRLQRKWLRFWQALPFSTTLVLFCKTLQKKKKKNIQGLGDVFTLKTYLHTVKTRHLEPPWTFERKLDNKPDQRKNNLKTKYKWLNMPANI